MSRSAQKRDTPEEQQDLLDQLMEGHQRFLMGSPQRKDYPFYDSLARITKRVATVLSCSDSRVSPELVFDQGFGDLFVVRSAGHCVDQLMLGSLEFAVEQVNSPLLIIMGHEDCRAVHAAMTTKKAASENLQAIIETIRPALDTLASSQRNDLTAAVKAHTLCKAQTLLEQSPILRKRADAKELMIAKLFYSVSTGQIEVL